MKYFSPAKLNLFFRVLRKRSDGYHDIASLFQAIDLGDDLFFETSDQDRLTCSDESLPCDASNLIWKALMVFRMHYDCPPVHIHLVKKIPMQAGFGGGSSNAATTLWALNQWSHQRISSKKLQIIGAQIGSDVPFFFSTGTAYCTGRGEVVESTFLSPFSGCWAKPSFGLSTPLVYRETRLEELDPVDPKIALSSFFTSQPQYFNDLEKAAFRIEPRLIAFKNQLLSDFQTVVMTGSGTAFFCFGKKHQNRSIPFHSIARSENLWYQ